MYTNATVRSADYGVMPNAGKANRGLLETLCRENFQEASQWQSRFKLDPNILEAGSATDIEVSLSTDADVVQAIENNQPFPARPSGKTELGSIVLERLTQAGTGSALRILILAAPQTSRAWRLSTRRSRTSAVCRRCYRRNRR
jgi:hypothetical protein